MKLFSSILLIITIIFVIIFISLVAVYGQTPFLNLVSVLIGGFLTICWTTFYNDYLNKQELKENKNKFLLALKEELSDDLKILKFNLFCINNELSEPEININLLSRLQGFKTDFWEFTKLNSSNLLEPTIFKDLNDSYFKMERINEYILLKENYKIINYHTNFNPDIVKDYNIYLLKAHRDLLELFQNLLKSLEFDDFNELL